MKNKKQWDYAQIRSASGMIKIGAINSALSCIAIFLNIPEPISILLGLSLIGISIGVLLFRTEKAISTKFNKEESRSKSRP